MNKFQRNYKIIYTIPNYDNIVEDQTVIKNELVGAEEIEIKYPLTCEFNIQRTTFSQANKATFRIYNLSLSNRTKMFQDTYNINRYVFIDFYAGYGDNLSLLFTGKVLSCMSDKQGTDIVTTIEALDNDIIQSYTNTTFQKGTPKKDVIKALAKDMPNTQLGAIGNFEGNLLNHLIFSDKTFACLDEITGGYWFVDLGKLNVLSDNEVLAKASVYKLTSESGLLGTPARKEAQFDVKCLLAPEILVGQLIEIESSTAPQFNGQYKVIGVQHIGTISGAICGTATTTLSLFVGSALPCSNSLWNGVINAPLSEVEGEEVREVTAIKDLGDIKSIREYLIKNGNPPALMITENISWSEVLMNYKRQGEVPSLEVLANLKNVAQKVQTFRDNFFPKNQIIITSGWRSKSYNATIKKAAKNSQHIQGKALDWHLKGVPNTRVYRYLGYYWTYGYRHLYGWGFHTDIRNLQIKGIANDI